MYTRLNFQNTYVIQLKTKKNSSFEDFSTTLLFNSWFIGLYLILKNSYKTKVSHENFNQSFEIEL